MSMSTSITGFKPPDKKWKAMKAALDACRAAAVVPPDEVQKFFGYDEPDEHGVEVSQNELEKCGAVVEYRDGMQVGFEVRLELVPADVKVIRFVNSY